MHHDESAVATEVHAKKGPWTVFATRSAGTHFGRGSLRQDPQSTLRWQVGAASELLCVLLSILESKNLEVDQLATVLWSESLKCRWGDAVRLACGGTPEL